MLSIARLSIERPLYPWLLIVILLVGGLWSLSNVGRLEDPNAPFSMALVVTPYPGASALEVEQEVTEVIETAVQRLADFDIITSKSLNGRSEVLVEVDESIPLDQLQQVWDGLRRRVRDAETALPPGSGTPIVRDDFGDIFGLMYAVAAPDYPDDEIRDMARDLQRTAKAVDGVSQVSVDGVPQEAIFLEMDHRRLTQLGLPINSVFQRISVENQVVPAGSALVDGRRLRIAPAMAFDSVEAVENLSLGIPGTSEIIRLKDIGRVTREQVEAPFELIRHNGRPVFTLGVSVSRQLNVVAVGKAVDLALSEHLQRLPIGVTIEPIYAQHAEVEKSVNQFLINLALSVGTVVLALFLFMGWRAGTIVGVVLLLSIIGTFIAMPILDVQLQRISLGALMIAMGMLVDNGIVVAEGMVVGVRQGLQPAEAAERAVRRTQLPLLGATIIGAIAFAPISLSNDDAGHFLISLFQVISVALLLSWILAITLIPMLGSMLLKPGEARSEDEVYSGWIFAPYRVLLGASLRRYWRAFFVLSAITGVCFWAFQYVKPGFFPTTGSPIFYVDYWLPEGTDIHTTDQRIQTLEKDIRELADVTALTSFVGRGANRFTAIMNPQQPNSSYAQIVGRVRDFNTLSDDIRTLGRALAERHSEAEIRVFRAEFTPGSGMKIEARFSGPSSQVLRRLADQALDIYAQHNLIDRSIDWRQPALTLVPEFDEIKAQAAGVSRQDVAQALAFASEGVQIGLYRDADQLVPIIARAPAQERANAHQFSDRLVWSSSQQQYIPMSQVVPEFKLQAQDTIIHRRGRERTITAMANPPFGHNPTFTVLSVQPEIEAIELPPGYRLEWGGEIEGNQKANEALGPGIAFGVLSMFLLTLLLFGRLTQTIIIWLTLPMIMCGVVVGLVATDLPFTFPAFLGLLSTIGMLIKNCIILVDEIDKRLDERGATVSNILMASVSRLRPVMLAAGTTIVGMSPLLSDPFFKEMAVCIMSALAFATVLTLIAVPVLYRIAHRRQLQPAGA